MSCLGSVMVDLSDKLENPGESYSFAGHIDAASYSVGDKDLALPLCSRTRATVSWSLAWCELR